MNLQIIYKQYKCALLILFLHILMMNMLYAQTSSNFVGAIPGAIDVSPMGAATYTIPIEVVPGTQGMQPNLSIVYNSFGGMGLLGMKWNLAGLSAITRCGQTLYFDSNITPIQLSTNDRFTLDGERLIFSSQDNSYGTEVENFTRIVPVGGTSPTHFIAYTDDGSIIEYGNTSNSKQQLGNGSNTILSWYINKVTDANGNTMSFTYWQPYIGEMCITSISYSSNSTAGIQSYAGVSFAYNELRDTLGKNTSYIAGYAIPRTKILESITVSYPSSLVRKYNFNYVYQTNTGERSPHLKEIIMYGEGGREQLKATSIKWGDPYYYTSGGLNLFDGYMITGDYNGDGLTDYVVYAQGAQQNSWKLFTCSKSGTFTDTKITGTHRNPGVEGTDCYFYKADVNGDGCDELIIAERNWVNELGFDIRILSLKDSIKMLDSKFFQGFYQLYFGDFDGDGSIDFLILLKETWNNNVCSFQLYLNNEFTGNRGLPSLASPCKVRVGDFNGNGKTDVEINYLNNDLYTCFFNNATSNFYTNYPLGTATYLYERYSGDFNGDGVADLLIFDGYWKVYFGKGDGGFTNATTIIGLTNQAEPPRPDFWVVPQYKILIADIDGDGKDDIIQLKPSSSLIICYSKGCVGEQYKYSIKNKSMPGSFTSHKSFNIADFDNDGILDVVLKERTSQTRVAYLNKNRQYEYPKEITDGLEKTLKFVYKPKYLIANNNTSQKYLCHLLESLKVSDGLNDFNTYVYSYTNPTFSWLRRTFLGFIEFICTNQTESKEDSYLYTLDESKQILKPVSQKTYYNTYFFSESNYVFSFIHLNNRYMPYYSEITALNNLMDVKTITTNSLDNNNGRLSSSNTKTYNACNSLDSDWLHSETKSYSYNTIIISGNQKKTAPSKILTTLQYGNTGVIIADTVTYCYYSAADKGRLKWMRHGNLDGVITTNYEYLTSGVCTLKTISTIGESPRKEYYEYENTHRFVTKIKNHLLHEITMTYDPKTGNKLKEIDANGVTTSYQYDNFGQLKQITHPEGTLTEITHNWYTSSYIPYATYCTKTTSTGKPTIIKYYDTSSREVCRLNDGYYFDTQYNSKGEVTKTSNLYSVLGMHENNKDWKEYTYDTFGRKLTEKASYLYLDLSYIYTDQSRKVTITDNLRAISSSKDYDALGRITQAQDIGGTIDYDYSVTGTKKHKTTISSNGATTTILSDLWGNRISIKEPNAGEVFFIYNGFNEIICQVDELSNHTYFTYDELGRITQKNCIGLGSPFNVDYYYDIAINGKGKLSHININNITKEQFTYDNLGRVSQHRKKVDLFPPVIYTYYYTYTPNGQLKTMTYPDGFGITYSYTSTGKLSDIRRSNDNSLIYKVVSRNKYNAPTYCEFGNGVETKYIYNSYGLITRIQTGKRVAFFHGNEIYDRNNIFEVATELDSSIQNYRYAYDTKGLMTSRSESVINRKENYLYDNLDRLTKVTQGSGATQTFSYYQNGNFNNNSFVGSYKYLSGKPHAVTRINPVNNNVISINQCDVNYTNFNQPTKITEGNYRFELSYWADYQRNKTEKYQNNVLQTTYCYFDKYFEYELLWDNFRQNNYHYIYGDNGVVALHINKLNIGSDSIYYIHTDHLGSYCAITDAGKNVKQRNFFDAWGNTNGTANFSLTKRGFTGHEHYPELKIINMNGRLYDPVIGRFFSPDNFVQIPEFTQSFNRYSYCLNNPLKYRDPSGQWFFDFDDDWDLNIRTGEMTWVSDLGGKDRHYVNLIDNGKSLGQYMFPGQNFSMNWEQDIYGNITLAMEGFASDFSSRATFFQQFYANETGFVMDGMRMSSVSYTAGLVDYSYYKSLATGRTEYSAFNVGDLIGAGMAVKALATAGAKAFSSGVATSGGRVFWSSGGNPAVRLAAETFAAKNGMTTLEMTRAGKNLTNLTNGMSWAEQASMWQRLSTQFAKGAKGPVHVFHNAGGIGAKSIWGTVEYPNLNKNLIIYHIVP